MLAVFSLASCAAMLLADYLLGAAAEFLNAYSVLERLMGNAPTAGESLVARRFGPGGELVGVLIVNLLIGLILTVMVELLTEKSKRAA